MTTSDLRIELIDSASDFEQGFDALRNAFGTQMHDGIWDALYPSWDTPAGRAQGVARLIKRWETCNPAFTTHLKATLPDPDKPGSRRIVGMAIWCQFSAVEGQGEPPQEGVPADFAAYFPGDEAGARYISQLLNSMKKRRFEAIRKKAGAQPSAVIVLDICAVDPAFQRRGAASALVQWGLDEAKRRGGLEAMTEGSLMGRLAYVKLGFRSMGEIEYEVDEEFAARNRPSNLFMRTGTDPK
ncbi:acetyltransferase [Mycena belliarum]|uniref:Acetyltransferase n=1 Tax=Mycena belliarum TaxID=1033014 RepID=A0AAD6TRZ3_9AGAR|nr:acetyltransferase [Mycena belliae]